ATPQVPLLSCTARAFRADNPAKAAANPRKPRRVEDAARERVSLSKLRAGIPVLSLEEQRASLPRQGARIVTRTARIAIYSGRQRGGGGVGWGGVGVWGCGGVGVSGCRGVG